MTFRTDRYGFAATFFSHSSREFHVSRITIIQGAGQRWASRRVKPAEKRRNDSKVMAKCSSNYRYAADERLRRTPRPCLLEVATTSIRISTKCPPFLRAFCINKLGRTNPFPGCWWILRMTAQEWPCFFFFYRRIQVITK